MPQHTPLFFLIAGEASGDLLGARLMRALKNKTHGAVRFIGIGGPRMQVEGMELFFSQTELAHFGAFEMVRHIPHILKRIRQTIAEVKRVRPSALITIDAPDFSFRVARKLPGLGIPLVHYVAPTVWIWRKGRAKKIAKFLDHLLALLPFEPPYFTREGLGCTFVGHSIVESGADKGDAERFRATLNVGTDVPIISVLPGSRRSEITRLLPLFKQTVQRLLKKHPALHVVIPTIPAQVENIRRATSDWPVPVTILQSDTEKYDAFAASRAALACSGTVAIELAMASLPSITAYRVHWLTAATYGPFVRHSFVNLVNIMHKSEVVPELLQFNCTPTKLAAAMEDLLTNETVRGAQIDGLQSVAAWLGQGQFVPSERAAEVVLDVVLQSM
jgi:lipid-A-disaccharide synthase